MILCKMWEIWYSLFGTELEVCDLQKAPLRRRREAGRGVRRELAVAQVAPRAGVRHRLHVLQVQQVWQGRAASQATPNSCFIV